MNLNPKTIKESSNPSGDARYLATDPGKKQIYRVTKETVKEDLDITALETQVNAIPTVSGTELEYTEVSISADDLSTVGTVPIELIAGVANTHILIDKMIIEYSYGTITYDVGFDFSVRLSTDPGFEATINKAFTATNDAFVHINGLGLSQSNAGEFVSAANTLGASLYLTLELSADPTQGDGTMLAKIWYKQIPLGSNL